MSRAGAFVRTKEKAVQARDEARKQFIAIKNYDLTALTDAVAIAETIRNRQFCLAQVYYLTAIIEQIEKIGSRGGAIVIDPENGAHIHPALPPHWRQTGKYRWRQSMLPARRRQQPRHHHSRTAVLSPPLTAGLKVWKNFREQTRSLAKAQRGRQNTARARSAALPGCTTSVALQRYHPTPPVSRLRPVPALRCGSPSPSP